MGKGQFRLSGQPGTDQSAPCSVDPLRLLTPTLQDGLTDCIVQDEVISLKFGSSTFPS